MENLRETNLVSLCGAVTEAPRFSHESRDVSFYTFPIEVSRLSGNVDRINIIARHELLNELEVQADSLVHIVGELRSYNNKSDIGNKLIITVYAREISFSGDAEENTVQLVGTICKRPNLRTTPMGRDICDIMLAVNRHYGRSDYLPCICWGIRARDVADFEVGTSVDIDGRIQSRSYTKSTGGEIVEKTAYEVSVTDIKLSE